MPLDELKARARRVADELLTQGDLAIADEVLAPDCRYHAPAPLAPGAEGMKQLVRGLRWAFPDLRAVVEDEIAEGDRVVQRLTLIGTHRGDFLGIPPTGKRAIWQLVSIQRLGRDGKIEEYWSSPDLFGLIQQLGAQVLPGTGPVR